MGSFYTKNGSILSRGGGYTPTPTTPAGEATSGAARSATSPKRWTCARRTAPCWRAMALLTLAWDRIEAQIFTAAMKALRELGVLAIHVHDSLIVAEEHEALAREALRDAWVAATGQEPRLT